MKPPRPAPTGAADEASERFLRELAQRARALGLDAAPRLDVACSGGLDSTVLLHALAQLARAWGCALRAHHVRHHLRDDAADAACARAQAEALGVPFVLSELDPPAALGPQGGLEAWARDARYAALVRAAEAADVGVLLTAQHGDDALEGHLLRLLRGSGLEGAGMAESRWLSDRVRLARPLLGMGRADIAAYAQAQGLAFVHDPSNDERQRARNALRLELVQPWLEALEPGTRHVLYASLVRLRSDACALDALAGEAVAHGVLTSERGWYLSLAQARALGRPATAQLLRHAARTLVPGHVPGARQVERALDGSFGEPQRPVRDAMLTMGREGRFVAVRRLDATAPPSPVSAPLDEGEPLAWRGLELQLSCQLSVVSCQYGQGRPDGNVNGSWSAAACCGNGPSACRLPLGCAPLHVVAAAEAGAVVGEGHGRGQRATKILAELGVPPPWRDGHPVVCDAQGPLWIVGGPRDRRARVTPGEDAWQVEVVDLPWYLAERRKR